MKKLISFTAILFSLILIFASCKKNDETVTERVTVEAAIKAGDTYSYNLGAFGDEEGAGIFQQAGHYQLSVINEDANRILTYTYKAASGFIGKDQVQIKTGRGSDGAFPSTKILITTINITVTN